MGARAGAHLLNLLVLVFAGGLVSETAVVSTMMMSFGTMAVVSVIWALLGYGIAFGGPAAGGGWALGHEIVSASCCRTHAARLTTLERSSARQYRPLACSDGL
jgi:Amt family ammonium transporter